MTTDTEDSGEGNGYTGDERKGRTTLALLICEAHNQMIGYRNCPKR